MHVIRPDSTRPRPGQGWPIRCMLAQAYTKLKAGDCIMAVWFFARAWNFAPANFKAQIEPQLEYYYKKYHGDLTGLDGCKDSVRRQSLPAGNLEITKPRRRKSRSTTCSRPRLTSTPWLWPTRKPCSPLAARKTPTSSGLFCRASKRRSRVP